MWLDWFSTPSTWSLVWSQEMASSGYVEGFILDVALPGFSEILDVLFIVVSDENTDSHKHVGKKTQKNKKQQMYV